MGRIWAIALNTFREAVRDRVLYGVLGAAIALLLFTLAIAQLSLNQEERVVRDLGLASISLFSVVVAVFLGSSLLYKEIDRKTLYVILPKPIRRDEFLIGKYLGITLTAAVFVGIMGGVQLWVASVQAGADALTLLFTLGAPLAILGRGVWIFRDRTAILVPWSVLFLGAQMVLAVYAEIDLLTVLYALLLQIGEVVVLTAVAMLFSSFSTPFLTGVLTTGVWLVGRSAGEMATVRSTVLPDAVRAGLRALAWVVPNFNLFVPPQRAIAGSDPASILYVGQTLAYGALYAAILLVFACLVWRRRDFA